MIDYSFPAFLIGFLIYCAVLKTYDRQMLILKSINKIEDNINCIKNITNSNMIYKIKNF